VFIVPVTGHMPKVDVRSAMSRIVLIQCASKKAKVKTKAEDLYISDLFRSSLLYAKRRLHPDHIFILSAKHGLLPLDKEVEPYDLTLKKMNAAKVKEWARTTAKQLSEHADLQGDHFIILAGERYRRYLLPYIPNHDIPMEKLRIGEQLQRLKKELR
jgi:hypothetical protein